MGQPLPGGGARVAGVTRDAGSEGAVLLNVGGHEVCGLRPRGGRSVPFALGACPLVDRTPADRIHMELGGGRVPQSSDGRLTVTAGGPAILVEQSATRPPIGVLIAGAHYRSVFSAGELGHRGPVPVGGLVTPVLRQPLPFR